MVEIKSVKVDNWGVFFLQKLQNFFNKTDYCDLTLQFQDNSQLKVHRLVLSACTDFFNILEQQCEVNDDILIMPRDLQADVVVPIVNFMYTGTLEFEVNMYGRLLKTARDMSMTVLLKLLEAHKRTVELPKAAAQRPHPVLLNKAPTGGRQTYAKQSYTPGVSPQRSYATARKPAASKVKSTPEKGAQSVTYIRKTLPEPVQLVARYANTAAATQKGPSRFDCSDDSSLPEHFDSSFDNISYESKPLITASQIKEEKDMDDDEPSTSANFEQLRKGYTGPNKRLLSSPSYGASPPEKKPNLKDIMEYTEAERIRKEIVAAEEFEGTEYVDDNFSNDDDSGSNTDQFKANKPESQIVIKDEPGNVNHAQIIHEVLKKYPHLVKNNKNIKLKILQKGGPAQSVSTSAATVPVVPVKLQTNITSQPAPAPLPVQPTPPPSAASKPAIVAQKLTPVATTKSYTATKATAAATSASTPVVSSAAVSALPQAPKKIDSKTMHALIAKGAENMTGPWLCLKCGVNGRPISIPSYKSFRRHLINVHRERIDPRICEHCGLKSLRKDELHHHMFMQHQIKPPADVHFPKCLQCSFVAPHNASLNKHREEKHPKPKLNAHHCIYCNKTFSNEILVYAHMRNNHKERACEDGVMDFDEDQDDGNQYIPNSEMIGNVGGSNIVVGSGGGGGMLVGGSSAGVVTSGGGDNKIKILSNISLPTKGIPYVFDAGAHTVSSIGGSQSSQHTPNINLEPSSEAEGLNTVASGIATSLAVLDQNDVIGGDAHDAYHTTTDTEGNELITNQYIETAMASVHGEYMKKVDGSAIAQDELTQFVTEEGSTLELTASQKADLLQQLQEQQNVVMILNEGESYDQSQMLTDDPNILVVYSHASDMDKQPKMVQTTSAIVSEAATTSELTTTTVPTTVPTTTEDESGDNDGKTDADDQKSIDDEMKATETEDDDMDIEPPSAPTAVSAEIKIEQQDPADDNGEPKTATPPTNVEKKEKPALLSALAGDWSEDENVDSETMDTSVEPDAEDARPATKSQNDEVTALPTQPKAQYSNRRTKPVDDDAGKEKKSDGNVTAADDKSGNKSDDDEPIEDEPTTSAANGAATVEEKDDDETKVKESDPLDSKISKNEIKTLINDWGDDEDDDD